MDFSAPEHTPLIPLLPREQGAYVQLGISLTLGLALGQGALAAWGQALLTALLFLASGPMRALMDDRGSGSARLAKARAKRLLPLLGAFALPVALFTWRNASWPLGRSLIVPATLASLLAGLILAKREHTGLGELVAAWALASAAYPVAVLGGADPHVAGRSGLALAGMQSIGTMTVRACLASWRRNGNPLLRWLPLGLGLVALAVFFRLPFSHRIALAMVPNTLLAAWMLVFPPASGRMKPLGWALTGASLLGTLPLLG